MALLFDSGALDFAANEGLSIDVDHNLGSIPDSIQFLGISGSTEGFPTLLDGEDEIPGPYLTQTRDPNTVKVHKPDAYSFSGQFKVRIYG